MCSNDGPVRIKGWARVIGGGENVVFICVSYLSCNELSFRVPALYISAEDRK